MDYNKLKLRSLTGDELLQIVDHKANLIRYQDIKTFTSIEDLFKNYDACVILYQLESESVGHWVLIFKVTSKTLEVFDPTGIFIDDELKYVKDTVLKYKTNQDERYLTNLLLKSDYTLSYNEHHIQADGTNTCGWHVALRLLNKNLKLQAYYTKFFKGIKDKDRKVVKTIMELL